MKPTIFFAIPCGEFYGEQAKIIKRVCDSASVEPIIVEHGLETSELWSAIIDNIERADYFVADISSLRPNIVLELGYALKAKHESRTGIFISRNVRMPADLSGKKRLEYSGFSDFQKQLAKWLQQVVRIDASCFASLPGASINFHDEFQDFDNFLRLWSTPPGCDFTLTHEGLRFTNANFVPIMTKTLGLLSNFEFTFTARILRGALGWVIKGTMDYRGFASFCVMFNTNLRELQPHILNINYIHVHSLYQPLGPVTASIQQTKDGWFTITTRCIGDTITIINNAIEIFQADFSTDTRFSQYYNFSPKQGQVGFRCHPSEEAIIRKVEIREI